MSKGKITLPKAQAPPSSEKVRLPFQGSVVHQQGFSFSFAAFDHSHEMFNLGDNENPSGAVSGKWFIDLFDCLKSVSNMTTQEMGQSTHRLHRIDWTKTNTTPPSGSEQCEYWQFRINKSKGRVIGVLIDSVFYVVWLDPHHNLTDSEGYGTVNWNKPAIGLYETQQAEIDKLRRRVADLEEERKGLYELIDSKSQN